MLSVNRGRQSRWPIGSIVSNTSWVSVAAYSDKMSAEAILGLLSGAGLPAYIKSDEHVPGLGSHFCVFVPPDRARQARRILEQGHVSEQELTDLATGGEKLDE